MGTDWPTGLITPTVTGDFPLFVRSIVTFSAVTVVGRSWTGSVETPALPTILPGAPVAGVIAVVEQPVERQHELARMVVTEVQDDRLAHHSMATGRRSIWVAPDRPGDRHGEQRDVFQALEGRQEHDLRSLTPLLCLRAFREIRTTRPSPRRPG